MYSRRSIGELRLSDQERHHRLRMNPNISMEAVFEASQSVALAKLERKESLNELKMQILAMRQAKQRQVKLKYQKKIALSSETPRIAF